MSHGQKTRGPLLSIESSWLFSRDSFIVVYERIPIWLGFRFHPLYTLNNQVFCFNCSNGFNRKNSDVSFCIIAQSRNRGTTALKQNHISALQVHSKNLLRKREMENCLTESWSSDTWLVIRIHFVEFSKDTFRKQPKNQASKHKHSLLLQGSLPEVGHVVPANLTAPHAPTLLQRWIP